MVTVRPEPPTDVPAVRHVNEMAFGRPEEARLVDALRDGGKAGVSLVAVQDGEVVGQVLFSEARIEGGNLGARAVALAPVAVLPAFQRRGVGSALITAGIEACRDLGYDLIVVVGHASYYPRFGFIAAREHGLVCEFDVPDEAWMVLELRAGALAEARGRVRFATEFQGVE